MVDEYLALFYCSEIVMIYDQYVVGCVCSAEGKGGGGAQYNGKGGNKSSGHTHRLGLIKK